MTKDIRNEWPHDSYRTAWQTFRALSSENELTGQHLVELPQWPKLKPFTLCDLGCGDGRLTEQLIIRSPAKIQELCLVEPDPELLKEANEHICRSRLVKEVRALEASVGEIDFNSESIDHVFTLIHVAYLMKDGELRHLLKELPLGSRLFVVLDHPESVFTQLWENTAPKYHTRAAESHQLLRELPSDQYENEVSEFESRIPNPLLLRDDIREILLSMLCYAPALELSEEPLREEIRRILSASSVGDQVVCRVRCYSVLRR